MLHDLSDGLKEKDITLEVSKKAKEFILDKSYNRQYGARPMRRFIEKNIEDKLAQMLIKGELIHGKTVLIDMKEDEITAVIK